MTAKSSVFTGLETIAQLVIKVDQLAKDMVDLKIEMAKHSTGFSFISEAARLAGTILAACITAYVLRK